MGDRCWDGVSVAESCFIRSRAVFQTHVFVAYIAINVKVRFSDVKN